MGVMSEHGVVTNLEYKRPLRQLNEAFGGCWTKAELVAFLNVAQEFDAVLVARVVGTLIDLRRKPTGPADLVAYLRRYAVADHRPHTMSDEERARRDADTAPIIADIRQRIAQYQPTNGGGVAGVPRSLRR